MARSSKTGKSRFYFKRITMKYLVKCEPVRPELDKTFDVIEDAKDYACQMSLQNIKHTFKVIQNFGHQCILYIYKYGTLACSFD